MNGCDLGANWALIGLVAVGLAGFGFAYNRLVDYWERRKYHEGFLSLIVAIGVGATLAGVAIIDWRAALLTLGAFVCSGTPMILGSIGRYVRRREAEQRALRGEG
jgi:MFS family permease